MEACILVDWDGILSRWWYEYAHFLSSVRVTTRCMFLLVVSLRHDMENERLVCDQIFVFYNSKQNLMNNANKKH